MKRLIKTAWGCLLPVLVQLLLTGYAEFLAGIGFGLWSYASEGSIAVDNIRSLLENSPLLITLVAALMSIPVFIVMMKSDDRHALPQEKPRTGPACVILCILGGLGGCLAGNALINITGLSALDQVGMEVSETIMNSPGWLILSCAVVFGPLMEELLFRGLIFRRIEASYGSAAGIILSALLFGLYHGNLSQGVFGCIMGLLLAYAYHKTGRIYIPVLMHMAANAGSFLVSILLGAAELLPVVFAEFILCMIGLMVGAAFVVVDVIYLHGLGNQS